MAAYDVVFIDDEPSLTEIFQHYVLWKYRNWRFLTFTNAVAAYREIIFGDLQSAVWIIDLMMPGKNGTQIAEAIRARHGEAPVLLAYTALDRQVLSSQEQYRNGMRFFNQVINKREEMAALLSLVDVWVENQVGQG